MQSTRDSILQSLRAITLIDPHTHINPHSPASRTLADLLGYHYYTELAHSAGMPKSQIESPGLSPRELVSRLVGGLEHLTNTAQYSWLVEICKQLYGFEHDTITPENWESLYDRAESLMGSADWATTVLDKANVSAVFLTNDFDDPLERFDTNVYIPCLRTDDLVFHLAKPQVRERLVGASGIGLSGSLQSLRDSLEQRFQHFVANGARACAISLPPSFSPAPVSDGRAATALDAVLRQGVGVDEAHRTALSRRVFWTIAELCDQYGLPFDLMIGVNREVYREGVHQGRDLYDSRVSLIQYAELFNAFPDVKFPISVLASVTNQELVSYAWIFPNVITSGHWWYSNTPSFIRRDAASRLEAVPRNKQIAYYSDAYKLEFIAPKFDMYRQTLADILFEDFVVKRGWSEEKAVELGYQVLRGNVEQIFPSLGKTGIENAPLTPEPAAAIDSLEPTPRQPEAPLWSGPESALGLAGAAGFVAGAATAAGALLDQTNPSIDDTIDLGSDLDDPMATNFFEDEESPASRPPSSQAEDTAATIDFSEPEVSMEPNPVTGELTWNVEQGDVDPNAETYVFENSDEPDEPRFGSPVPEDLLETLDLNETLDLDEPLESVDVNSLGQDSAPSDPFEDDSLQFESASPSSTNGDEAELNQTIAMDDGVSETVEFDSFDELSDEFDTSGDIPSDRPDEN